MSGARPAESADAAKKPRSAPVDPFAPPKEPSPSPSPGGSPGPSDSDDYDGYGEKKPKEGTPAAEPKPTGAASEIDPGTSDTRNLLSKIDKDCD